MNREERLTDLKFEISYQAPLLDRSNQESLNSFNKLLEDYRKLKYSKGRDIDFEKKAQEIMKNWKL